MKKWAKINSFVFTAFFIVVATAFIGYFSLSNPYYYTGHAIPVFLAEKNDSIFNGDTLSTIRQYRVYILTNDPNKNRAIFIQAGKNLKEIKIARDTVHGIEIVLHDQSTFQDLVTAIDICRKNSPEVYCISKNHIYAMFARHRLPKKGFHRPCIY